MKLGKLCILFTDGDWIESKDQSDSGIRLIQTGNIGNGEFLYKNDKAKYISVDTFKRLNCKEVFPNDILVSRLPEPVGRGCIIPDIGEKMITAVDCTICRINENLVDRKYFCYFLESNAYKTQLEQHVTGTTRKRISRKNLSSVEIDIPEQAKQKEVVYKLDRLKKIIQNYNRELDLLDELVRARFVEMFGDLRVNDKGWKYYKLDELTELITDGEHATPKRTTQGIYLLSARNVLNHQLSLEDVDYIDYDEFSRISRRIIPREGDVLISCSGSIGRCCVVPKNIKFQMVRSIALLRFKSNINPVFAEYMITSDYLQDQINKSKTVSSQANLFQGKIKSLKGVVPPLELQNQFASFVQEIDKSRLLSNHSLFLIKSIIL